MPKELHAVLAECMACYEHLHQHRIQALSELMLQTFDERNRDILINIDGALLHRDEAGISPFDSVVQGGDAVWEGLRVYDGESFD